MRKSTSGFTIVELLVVIAVIGILTTITLIGFTRYQMSNRDTERESKTTVLAEALEKYYDNNGEYPGCTAVNSANTALISQTVLMGVESKTYLTPKSATGNTNSIECINITGATGEEDVFAYVGDGSAACNTATGTGAACLSWTLKYKEESTSSIKSVTSRRSTNITTSGTIAAAANPVNFTQINTSWNGISNAINYELQWSTNNSFTGPGTQTTTSPSFSVTGLNYNTQYYFRVRAIASVTQGEWSATVSSRTWGLTTPVTTAVRDPASPSTKFVTSWLSTTHAASYNVQCSTNGTTWSGCNGSTTALSYSWGPTSQGTILYFRTQAVSGPHTSSWSAIANATTTIDAPAAFAMDYTNTMPNWNYLNVSSPATCPAGTSPETHFHANGAYWTNGSAASYGLGWGNSVSILAYTRCVKGSIVSSWTASTRTADMGLPIPTVWVGLPGDSVMYWGGTCPKWTSAANYNWWTNGRIAASGSGTATQYGPPATWWGDGNAHVQLSCTGPWGTYTVETTGTYGPGCTPVKTKPECSY